MPKAYIEEFERVARLAWSMWNRDPASLSFGSFDRQYWGWKYKDFSDATLQYAIRLAIEYARGRGTVGEIPALLDGFVACCHRMQHLDGSFDQCYPYERTPGVVFDILSTLIYVRQSGYLESRNAQGTLDGIIERAARFTLRTDETHGRIANHYAEYAYELFRYARYAGSDVAAAKAQTYLERLLALFDPTEGWFEEYAGPDSGYQTRTLRYLVKIAELNEMADLWPIIERAAAFVGELMMPDGALHPMLGSRSTALLYPSAFETLARRQPHFRPLAERVRQAWRARAVPLPSEIDFCNAIRLADDALDAATVSATETASAPMEPAPVERIDMAKAGIAIRRNGRLALYVNWRMGGVIVIYARTKDGWRLAYEDSGYLIESGTSHDVWLTRMPDAGRLMHCSAESVRLQAFFYRSLHDEVTTLRLIALRILNMTLLRFQWLADLFRKMVVMKLMGRRVAAPVSVERTIDIGDTLVTITDRFATERHASRSLLGAALYRCRRMTGTHMASSRYLQEAELAALPSGWKKSVAPNVAGAGPLTTKVDLS